MSKPVAVEDDSGFMVYSNIKYDGEVVTDFRDHQIKFIKFCESLALPYLKTKYDINTISDVSIKLRTGHVYNNIQINNGNSIPPYGDKLIIKWISNTSMKPQQMEFNRIYKSKQDMHLTARTAAFKAAYLIYIEGGVDEWHGPRVNSEAESAWYKVLPDKGLQYTRQWATTEWANVKDVVIATAKVAAAKELAALANKGASGHPLVTDEVFVALVAEAKAKRLALLEQASTSYKMTYNDFTAAAEAEAAAEAAAARVAAAEAAAARVAAARAALAQEAAQENYETGGGNKIRKRTKMKKIKRKNNRKTNKKIIKRKKQTKNKP